MPHILRCGVLVVKNVVKFKQKIMKKTEKIQFILDKFYKKICRIDYYEIPITVKNGWIGNINNCICYIEILLDGSDEITDALKNAGFSVKKIGRELYVTC